MTSRIYYADAYATDFEANVIAVERGADGRTGVVLDRTAFYPSSGGQPFDIGRLGGAQVVEVVDREDGSILHIVDGPVPEGRVAGRVDWPRRFEHMQQHTGQHVLSAAFDRLHDVRTASFHLGSAAATIDLAREVTAAEIAAAEDLANTIVWEDRPVAVRFVDEGEAAALPLRREPVRAGQLRVVEVSGFDLSACGGTHVARTGAIGMIAIARSERFRGGTRVEFHCGIRMLQAHRRLRDSLGSAIRLVSGRPEDLAGTIERLQAENKELTRRARDLEERLAGFEADALAARAERIGAWRGVLAAVDAADAAGLKAVAQRLAARSGHLAVLVTPISPVSVVIARAPDAQFDASAALKQLVGRFGGRGGGRPEMAQGGGLGGSAVEILAAARQILGGDR